MKITFREFRDFLCGDGCSEEEARRLYGAVRSMEPETRRWVIRWFCTGELPGAEIEGVTAKYLIDSCGYKPLNAFIVLDWLKADPQAAKYFVMKMPAGISPSSSIGQEVSERMGREGHEIPPHEPADEGDIIE